MKFLPQLLGAVALASVCAASQAAVVFSTTSLTGDVSVTGFADGTPSTFAATYSNLAGTVNLLAMADGNYSVSAQGAGSFTGFAGPGGTVSINVPTATPVFSGFMGSSGLTPGAYSFVFGSALGGNIPFNYTINYDGNASPQVMSALALLGFPFVNPDGAGSLAVTGVFAADGTTATLNFVESNLTWAGFGQTLRLADFAYGGGNGIIDGSFSLSNVVVTAVPEPATLALVGLSLLGLAATRRRA